MGQRRIKDFIKEGCGPGFHCAWRSFPRKNKSLDVKGGAFRGKLRLYRIRSITIYIALNAIEFVLIAHGFCVRLNMGVYTWRA